ncbi:MAG: choice-of-anchor Q domain-containing protein [Bacteroidales bacterium]
MVRLFRFLLTAFFLGVIASGFFSCREEGFDTDPGVRLSFSADSVLFDTVFTSLGSSTRALKVYNDHHRRISISSISLAGGGSSYFRLNVDGSPATVLRDVEVGANDSLFIFVEVTVDPVNQDLPLVITDSIVFNTNNNIQDVKLVAWGQDAHFIHPNYTDDNGLSYHLIQENATWTSQRPYVVYGLAVVDSAKVLTVQEGARIHFHNNASLIIYKASTLKVMGSQELPVVFQGDRLEPFYEEQPGQWGRIWLYPTSKDHEIHHAIIKNGTVGLQVDTIGSTIRPTLEISNTVIRNMSLAGIVAQGSNIEATNTVIANCGEQALLLALGGSYDFRHCTFANYFNLELRQTPSVLLNNYYVDTADVVHHRAFEHIYFGNTIIYGSLQEELLFDFLPGTSPEYLFDHSLLRTQKDVSTPSFINVIRNQNPEFNNIGMHDFRLTENSPAIGAANPEVALQIPFDILGNERSSRHDIGAYQYYEIEEED